MENINVLIKKIVHQKENKILSSHLNMVSVLNHAIVLEIISTHKMKHIVQMIVEIKYGDNLVIKEYAKMKQNAMKTNI